MTHRPYPKNPMSQRTRITGIGIPISQSSPPLNMGVSIVLEVNVYGQDRFREGE